MNKVGGQRNPNVTKQDHERYETNRQLIFYRLARINPPKKDLTQSLKSLIILCGKTRYEYRESRTFTLAK